MIEKLTEYMSLKKESRFSFKAIKKQNKLQSHSIVDFRGSEDKFLLLTTKSDDQYLISNTFNLKIHKSFKQNLISLNEMLFFLKINEINFNNPYKTIKSKTKIIKEHNKQTYNTITEDYKEQKKISYINNVKYIYGPTNSGKTYEAMSEIDDTKQIVYLSPLRLLAWEIYEELKQKGFKVNLVTGEEKIIDPDANITCSTVEMFNIGKSYDLVILDEAQLIFDERRGGAWSSVLLFGKIEKLILISSIDAVDFYNNYFNLLNIPIENVEKQKLCELQFKTKNNKILKFNYNNIPPNSILVVFSRLEALKWKVKLSNKKTSIIYGALPPQLRQKQAERFRNGETNICIATDAIGMGLNLPAEYVIFTTLRKFDGKDFRLLNNSEFMQIAGRAGRFGKFDIGKVGIMNNISSYDYEDLFKKNVISTKGYISPTLNVIDKLDGNIFERFSSWSNYEFIPHELKKNFTRINIQEIIELSEYVRNFNYSIKDAFTLCMAPTNRTNFSYWKKCVNTLYEYNIILPPQISSGKNAKLLESDISQIELYKWFTYRFPYNEDEKNYINNIYPKLIERLDNMLVDGLQLVDDDEENDLYY